MWFEPPSSQLEPQTPFGGVEPPQTHSNVPCRPVSPFVTVLRGGSVYSNLPERTRFFPVGLFPHSSPWFEEVRWGRTAPNTLQRSL